VVDSWDEVLGASNNELEKKFASLKGNPTEKAFFSYWAAEILRAEPSN
jgi:hypothetical protein